MENPNYVELIYRQFYNIKNCIASKNEAKLAEELKDFYELIKNRKQYNDIEETVIRVVQNLVSITRYYLDKNTDLTRILQEILKEVGLGEISDFSFPKPKAENLPKNIHIGVMYHKKFKLFANECLYPIHVGKAYSDFELGILGDNTGENISLKNPAYAELTGLYWIWKNVKADVKGIMHYRRFLYLSGNNANANLLQKDINDDFNPSSFLNNCCLTTKNISKLMDEYDILLRKEDDFNYWSDLSISSHYKNHHIEKHLETALQIIRQVYPEMFPSVLNTFCGTKNYFTNVFVMKNEEFDKCCAWVFDVLEKIEKTLNPYDINLAPETVNTRWAGYLGERLIGAYLRKRVEDGVKTKEFPLIMINEPNKNWTNADTYSKETLKDLWLPKMNTDKVLVSVVVNSLNEKFLKSIINQTICNIEIILTNKDSEINSINHPRLNIRKIDTKDLKSIVEFCNGKFVHFMDEDDIIQKDFYKNILSNALRNNSDIVLSSYKKIYSRNFEISKTHILPATIFGGGMNVKNNIDILMDESCLFSKLFSKEFLLKHDEILDSKNHIEFWWKAVLNAENVSVLRDYQYQRMTYDYKNIIPQDLNWIFETFKNLDRFIKNSDKNRKEMFEIFKSKLIYDLICKNVGEIAEKTSHSEMFLENLKKLKPLKLNPQNEQKLDFYLYDKVFMQKIYNLKNKEKIREAILDNLMSLTLNFNEIDLKYLNKKEIV